MKKMNRFFTLLMAAIMTLSLISTAFAADVATATIDTTKKASLELYKYDLTRAEQDGKWDSASYVSTGLYDQHVNDVLGDKSFTNNSATNNLAYGYAIKGVEFTYLKVASISTYSQQENGAYKVGVLYGFTDDTVLKAIGLTTADAYTTKGSTYYFTSDVLNKALSDALTANATTTKNALEKAVKNGGEVMDETDEYGYSKVNNLAQGLYLLVETRVPDMVTCTCNPFFVSLPMTTIDGTEWNYDVTVYPKNNTGMPDLDKTVREAAADTGKNGGSTTHITDGYDSTATASVGDVVDYQIISHLPTITSEASYLTTYTYVDTLTKGIAYNKNDVVIRFYKDAACNDLITTWDESSNMFAVSYDAEANTMTISMTDAGLQEMNSADTVYDANSLVCGYSDCFMRITYSATLMKDAINYGDIDNPNEVQLTWKRTNTTYYDVLNDCCHVYTYGVDLLKQFSDGKGNLANVHFNLHNDTDGYYVTAELVDGVYHVTGHVDKESEATVFIPVSDGHIKVMGLEDDTYTVTETQTDKDYVLLKDDIEIVITTKASGNTCDKCHTDLLTAVATVNGDSVTMEQSHAIVPLTVVNNPGFNLPKTGSYGNWMYTVGGVAFIGAALFILLRHRKSNKED